MEAGDGADADWDDWEPDTADTAVAAEEPAAAEEEEDPFASMGMAPVVTKTRRHSAVRGYARHPPAAGAPTQLTPLSSTWQVSVWAEKAAPISSRFAMTEEDVPLVGGSGWVRASPSRGSVEGG